MINKEDQEQKRSIVSLPKRPIDNSAGGNATSSAPTEEISDEQHVAANGEETAANTISPAIDDADALKNSISNNDDDDSDASKGSGESGESQETFHSTNEHALLLTEEQRNGNSASCKIITGNQLDGVKIQPLPDHYSENEEDDLLREKKYFEEEGMVTLYSSRKSKTRRFNQSEYKSCDVQDHHSNNMYTSETNDESFSHDGDESRSSSVQNVNSIGNNLSSQSSDASGGIRSDFIGSSGGNSNIASGITSSPTNELRQRIGGAHSFDSVMNGNDNIGNTNFEPNRVRSYTSPDTRSSARSRRRNRQFAGQSSRDRDHHPPRSPQRSLRISLDAGILALRRWMVSRSPGETSHPRPSRAARVAQMQNDDLETNVNSALSLGDEDYFALSSAGERRQASSSSRSNHGSVNSGGSTERTVYSALPILYPQTIQEEDEPPSRQRANSEPERSRTAPWRSLTRRRRESSMRSGYPPLAAFRRSRRRQRAVDTTSVASLESGGNSLPSDLILDMMSNESPNRVSFQLEPQPYTDQDDVGIEMQSTHNENGDIESSADGRTQNNDIMREARRNWILINRRFQVVVILVGIIFSFLVFSIMVTWVVLTSAYVVSIDEVCDVPLKPYFWLATIQIILDVFRKEIMKFIFRFDPNRHRQQIPTRVIFYNLAYLTYAMLVLRIGISSVFLSHGSECARTASKLFNTTRVFVSISIAAWMLVLFGYFIPFCIVAVMLTRNGYSPASEDDQNGRNFGVFPLTNVNNSAPSICIDLLGTLRLEDFSEDYPRECCICMTDFVANDTIVVTKCEHVFHKGCCEEWLRHARTCPVCRTDIPESLNITEEEEENIPHNSSLAQDGLLFSRGPFRSSEFQQDLVQLVTILRETNQRPPN